jgi:hypothetical protein
MEGQLRGFASFFRLVGIVALFGFAVLAFNAYSAYDASTGTMGVSGAILWFIVGVAACLQAFWCAAISEALAELLKGKATATPAPQPTG